MIKRFDHRARFRTAYLNGTIDQINQLNKTRFTMFGNQPSTGGILMGGSAMASPVYIPGDINFYDPAISYSMLSTIYRHSYWTGRFAIPTWGVTIETARQASKMAEEIRYNARGGAYIVDLENNGWGGYNMMGVQAEDLLVGGGYMYDDDESFGRKTDSVYDPYDPITNPFPGLGSVPWDAYDNEDWPHSVWNDAVIGPPTGRMYKMGAPTEPALTGVMWGTKAFDGSFARVYPIDSSGVPPFGGNQITSAVGNAYFKVTTESFGFMHLLCSLPPGAQIVKAVIPIKVSSYSRTTQTETYDPIFVPRGAPFYGGTWDPQYTFNVDTVTSGSVSYVVMARARAGTYIDPTTGRTKRATNWHVIGSSSVLTATSNEWSIVDVTDLCNYYINTLRQDLEHFEFLIYPMPDIGGTPTPGSDPKDWLDGLIKRPDFFAERNPDWNLGQGDATAMNHGFHAFASPHADQIHYQDYGPYNKVLVTDQVTWGGLEFAEGVIEFTYPDSLTTRTLTYGNLPRGDTP